MFGAFFHERKKHVSALDSVLETSGVALRIWCRIARPYMREVPPRCTAIIRTTMWRVHLATSRLYVLYQCLMMSIMVAGRFLPSSSSDYDWILMDFDWREEYETFVPRSEAVLPEERATGLWLPLYINDFCAYVDSLPLTNFHESLGHQSTPKPYRFCDFSASLLSAIGSNLLGSNLSV